MYNMMDIDRFFLEKKPNVFDIGLLTERLKYIRNKKLWFVQVSNCQVSDVMLQ